MAKKVNNLLKGVAITGATVGGAYIFSDANLVYAMEETSDGTIDVEVTETPTETQVEYVATEETPAETVVETPAESSTETTEETTTETTEETTEETTTETPEETTEETTTETPATLEETATSELASDSQVASETANSESMTDEEIYESESYSLSEEDEELFSNYQSTSESLELTSTSLSETLSEAENTYQSESIAYTEKGYDRFSEEESAKLTELETEINRSAELLDEYRVQSGEAGKSLDNTEYYSVYGNNLAFQIIQYKLILDGEITTDYLYEAGNQLGSKVDGVWEYKTNTCVYSYWNDKGYEFHHFCIKYLKATTQEYVERYFDYVTCDEEGNSLWENNRVKDNTSIVRGINMVEKEPVYDYNRTNGDYYQRVDFVPDEERGTKKGKDWYTQNDLLADITNRTGMAEELASLSELIASMASNNSEFSESVNNSLSESAIASTSRMESLSERTSWSLSASEYKSESLSLSTSEMESATASAENSTSASTSEYTSLSISEAESLSASEAVSLSISEAESLSTSESESVSTSSAESEVAVTTGNSNSGNGTTSSSSGRSAASVSTTNQTAALLNGNADNNGNAGIIEGQLVDNPQNQGNITVNDDQVPLAVVYDEERELADETDEMVTQILDEETPLGMEVVSRTWWNWILIVIGLITGTVVYDKQRKEFLRKTDK